MGLKPVLTMIQSMTGYGRSTARLGTWDIKVEIKSVNHKGTEIAIHTSKEFAEIESSIYSFISQRIHRGRIDVYLTVSSITESGIGKAVVDVELARQYLSTLWKIAHELQLGKDITLGQLITLPGVIKFANEEKAANATDEVTGDLIAPVIADALANLTAARGQEGDTLAEDIYSRLTQIELKMKEIQELAPEVVNGYRQRLQSKLANLIEEQQVDSARLALEIGLLAERSDITEELVRIESHLDQFRNTMQTDGAIGRRLDFILQELFREISTVGAKASHAEIAELVVDIKTELDKIKQQVQNIE